MKETSSTRRKYKSRKTTAPSYAAKPPDIPSTIDTFYLRSDTDLVARQTARFGDELVTSHTVYKPGLLMIARLTFRGTRWQIHFQRDVSRVIPYPAVSQMPSWEANLLVWGNKNASSAPEAECLYAVDNTFDFSVEKFSALQEDFAQFLISTESFELQYNSYLKLLRDPEESDENFIERCLEQIREQSDQEIRTLDESILMQQERIRERLEREIRERSENPMEAETILINDPAVARLKQQITSLEGTREDKRKEFEENFNDLARQQENDFLRLSRSDIEVTRSAIVWLPHIELIIQEENQRLIEVVQSF